MIQNKEKRRKKDRSLFKVVVAAFEHIHRKPGENSIGAERGERREERRREEINTFSSNDDVGRCRNV